MNFGEKKKELETKLYLEIGKLLRDFQLETGAQVKLVDVIIMDMSSMAVRHDYVLEYVEVTI